ncbi:MAG: aminopeptidase P family protein, partial [Rhizobiales bacterium]|nr:aminopeptidase P family protein [Hyphomicrobiales bacterium]
MSTKYNSATCPQVPARGFTAAEFETRCARTQKMMAVANIDALLLTTEPEIRYFTGFLTRFWLSPTRPWFLLVPASGKPVAIIPSIGADSFAATWLDDVRTWPSPQPEDEGLTLLSATLNEIIGPSAQIGMPEGPETHLRMPMGDFTRLRSLLPNVSFTDATEIIRDLRMIKSPAEIEKISYICDLVSGVFEDLPELIHSGMSEIDIFRQFKISCLTRGVDDVDYLVGGAGPSGYTNIISPPSRRRVGPGDVLMLDTGAVFDGYFCDFDRNYVFSKPEDHVKRAYETLIEATQAGFDAALVGRRTADVFEAMNRVLVKENSQTNNVGRMGHGLGMQITEWPSLTATDQTQLRPGMVLTLEPALDLKNGAMMVHEENILIGADGPTWLTR